MAMTRSPLNDAVADGYNVRNHLNQDAMTMRLTLEQKQVAQQAYTSAKRAYEDAEAEWLADFTWNDDAYRTAKNAEQREILKDAALVKARRSGALAQPWRILGDCDLMHQNAVLAYEQADVAFKAVRIAAELTSSLLRAASI